VADPGEHVVEDDRDLLGSQAVRPADADIEIDVLHERRNDDSLVHQSLGDQIARLAAVEAPDLGPPSGFAQERASDVDRAVRPRGHREVLDDLRHPLIAVDEHHISWANPTL